MVLTLESGGGGTTTEWRFVRVRIHRYVKQYLILYCKERFFFFFFYMVSQKKSLLKKINLTQPFYGWGSFYLAFLTYLFLCFVFKLVTWIMRLVWGLRVNLMKPMFILNKYTSIELTFLWKKISDWFICYSGQMFSHLLKNSNLTLLWI
jgi:hypothetical protein